MRCYFILFLLVLGVLLPFQKGECRKGEPSPLITNLATAEEEGPWFTGPLISPSAQSVPFGYTNIEPYFFATVITGRYDEKWKAISEPNFYSYVWQVVWQLGLTEFMDFFASPTVFYNRTRGESSAEFGDLSLGFDFQVVQESPANYLPSVKFSLRENFPTGRYNRLNAKKKGTDVSGTGAYTTSFALAVGRLFKLSHVNYLNVRVASVYSIPTHVHVHNLSAYGGGLGTRGKVNVGNALSNFFAFELSLSRNWVFSADLTAFYTNKSKFHGNKGFIAPHVPAKVGFHSSSQYSTAPAIEYNWSAQLGMIAGVWFTFAGRNTSRFTSGVIALNYYGPIKTPKRSKETKFPGGGGGGSAVASTYEYDSRARRILTSIFAN